MVSLRGVRNEHVRCLAEWRLWRSAPHQSGGRARR